MQFPFTAPHVRDVSEAALGGVPQYTGIAIRGISMDLDAGTVNVLVSPIEQGGPGKVVSVVITLTPTQINNFSAAIKAALQAKFTNVTFA